MTQVKIIDAIMGSGKTYDAIQKMKKKGSKFVYVTPFLKEVERVLKAVPTCSQPKIRSTCNSLGAKSVIYKKGDLLNIANGGGNIVTTHALFSTLQRSDYSFFVDHDLILDEVLTPIKILDMSSDDIKIAFNQGLAVANNITGVVTYTGNQYRGEYYRELKMYCETSNVIYLNGRLLVWAFPPEIFRSFKSVTVLTYLFQGSLLSAYFDYYGIGFTLSTTPKVKEKAMKKQIKKLLNIYYGKANDIGNRNNAFSVTWLKNKSDSELKKISKSAENLIKRTFKTKSPFNAYTTFKPYKTKLKGKGYTKGFIAVNERATNKYSDIQSMIYFANRFLEPNIIDFFRNGNVVINQEQWALAELIQWVWRGVIRNNKPMNLYIPSKRMRDLLENWLNS